MVIRSTHKFYIGTELHNKYCINIGTNISEKCHFNSVNQSLHEYIQSGNNENHFNIQTVSRN